MSVARTLNSPQRGMTEIGKNLDKKSNAELYKARKQLNPLVAHVNFDREPKSFRFSDNKQEQYLRHMR